MISPQISRINSKSAVCFCSAAAAGPEDESSRQSTEQKKEEELFVVSVGASFTNSFVRISYDVMFACAEPDLVNYASNHMYHRCCI